MHLLILKGKIKMESKIILILPGIEIFDRSLPIFLHNKFHRFNELLSGMSVGNFWRLPVIRVKVQFFSSKLRVTSASEENSRFGDSWIRELRDWGSKDSNSVDIELGAVASSNGWKKKNIRCKMWSVKEFLPKMVKNRA